MRKLIAILLALLLWGCGDAAAPVTPVHAPIDTLSREVHPGTLVSTPGDSTPWAFVWSADGASVYYSVGTYDVGHGPWHVRRASLDGAPPTDLDLGAAVPWVSSAAFPPLAFLASAPGGDVYLTALRSVTDSTRGVLRLREGADPSWVPGLDDVDGVAVAGQDRYLVYGTGVPGQPVAENLASVDLATGAVTPLGTGIPLALSADGSELLYAVFPDAFAAYIAVNLATGATRTVSVGPATSTRFFSWPSRGLYAVFDRYPDNGDSVEFLLRDVTAATTTPFYEKLVDQWTTRLDAFSADASKVAISYKTCVSGLCEGTHTALYVIEVPEGTARWVAGVDNARIAYPAFAPDGRHIAYLIQGSVYVAAVP